MKTKKAYIKYLLGIVLSFICTSSFAQTDPTDSLPDDPGAIKVYSVQNMGFGTFIAGNTGGSVSIATDGTRSSTGTVIPLNGIATYFQAIYEIEGPAGCIISILNGPDATLTGSNGGSMSLHLNNSSPVSPFITVIEPPGRTQVSIGGTLTVGNSTASPPGRYTGTFYVTFNQE